MASLLQKTQGDKKETNCHQCNDKVYGDFNAVFIHWFIWSVLFKSHVQPKKWEDVYLCEVVYFCRVILLFRLRIELLQFSHYSHPPFIVVTKHFCQRNAPPSLDVRSAYALRKCVFPFHLAIHSSFCRALTALLSLPPYNSTVS